MRCQERSNTSVSEGVALWERAALLSDLELRWPREFVRHSEALVRSVGRGYMTVHRAQRPGAEGAQQSGHTLNVERERACRVWSAPDADGRPGSPPAAVLEAPECTRASLGARRSARQSQTPSGLRADGGDMCQGLQPADLKRASSLQPLE